MIGGTTVRVMCLAVVAEGKCLRVSKEAGRVQEPSGARLYPKDENIAFLHRMRNEAAKNRLDIDRQLSIFLLLNYTPISEDPMKHAALSCIVALCLLSTVARAQLQPLSAREGFAPALTKAQSEFASDVYLANIFFAQIEYNSVKVTLDMSTGQATGWLYRFYSPSKDSSVLYVAVKIILLGVQAVQPPTGTTIPIPALPGVLQFVDPWVDSPTALAAAKGGGGAVFLAAHPDAAVDLVIGINSPVDNPLVPKGKYWLIRFASGADNLTCAINAETGISVNCGQLNDVTAMPAASDFRFGNAHPNPTSLSGNTVVTIDLVRSGSSQVRVAVVDVLGRELIMLQDESAGPGTTPVRIDPALLDGPGVYFVVAESEGKSALQKLIVTK